MAKDVSHTQLASLLYQLSISYFILSSRGGFGMTHLSVIANKKQSGTANAPKHESEQGWEVANVKDNVAVWLFRVSCLCPLFSTHSTTVCWIFVIYSFHMQKSHGYCMQSYGSSTVAVNVKTLKLHTGNTHTLLLSTKHAFMYIKLIVCTMCCTKVNSLYLVGERLYLPKIRSYIGTENSGSRDWRMKSLWLCWNSGSCPLQAHMWGAISTTQQAQKLPTQAGRVFIPSTMQQASWIVGKKYHIVTLSIYARELLYTQCLWPGLWVRSNPGALLYCSTVTRSE